MADLNSLKGKGAAVDGVHVLLRLEGLALFAAALGAYVWNSGTWWLFAVLFFAPDLSFLAYLAGTRIGAAAYNTVHSTVGPIALAAIGVVSQTGVPLLVALIWAAHVGFDRAFGYGLKYPNSFQATHLGWIGRAESPDADTTGEDVAS